jgi:cobalt/nickel transport protein
MKLVLLMLFFLPFSLFAHFQMLLPTKSIVENQSDANIEITYKFMHPFERHMMHMQKPSEVGVFIDGKKEDLASKLIHIKEEGFDVWKVPYKFQKPAMYQFYVTPQPYFEPAEEKFIIHQTKVIIDAYGSGEGWDRPIGLKAEIIPLSRPYGLYNGNIFSAKVLYKGKVAKNVEVEVEFYNDKGYKAPTSSHVTQVVKTDEFGVFHFVMPRSGWWGYAALIEDDIKLKKDNIEYPVELGALIWVYCEDMK